MIYRRAYESGMAALEKAGVAEAALDARLLLEFVCKTTRNDLYAHSEYTLTDAEEKSYLELIEKRAKRIPLQHLTGEQEFMGLSFLVNENVLIPRQDTETLVEEALIAVNDSDRVLDLCTGSGCVIISIMKYKNDIEGVATDISKEALAVAEKNAERLLDKNNGTLTFLNGDLYCRVSGAFEVIVSNPPYIRDEVIETLETEVKDHDPRIALSGGSDGLDFYRKIAQQARMYLKNEGKLMLEIGHDQAESVSEILKENGFADIKVVKDLAGNDRVVRGCLYDEENAKPGEMERVDW